MEECIPAGLVEDQGKHSGTQEVLAEPAEP